MKTNKIMDHHSSYHQSIPGDEAERRLREFNAHCYLTRFSDRHECYMLSVFQRQRPTDVIKHFKIIIKDDGKHMIDGKDEEHNSIGQLLTYYEDENSKLDPSFRTIGQKYTEDQYKRRSTRRCQIL